MQNSLEKNGGGFLSLLLAVLACFLAVSMLIWPEASYRGASFGLELWATVLAPSLLPFFIIAEILLSLGIVAMVGEMVEPLMRPLFNLPGAASFVVTMGFTSGFPMGAVLARRLYEERLCTREEGERLAAFTNNSSPLFILAAVGVGMFRHASLGVVLAVSHYCSNLLFGVFLGVFSPRSKQPPVSGSVLNNSIRAIHAAWKKKKPPGQLLGDAVRAGINSITLIGGFIVFFAVLTGVLQASGLQARIEAALGAVLTSIGLHPSLKAPLATGFWEMTLGLQELSRCDLPFTPTAVCASVILGWSGLSIQAQVASVLAGSEIKPRLYCYGRIVQSVLAGAIAFLLSVTGHVADSLAAVPACSAFPVKGSPLVVFKYHLVYGFWHTCQWSLLGMAAVVFVSGSILCLQKIKK